MKSSGKLQFEASARLQRLIGRGLVPNEEMAIVELVKNAYDSGAKKVEIFIQPDRIKEPGLIRIKDDGSGMSLPDIQRHFMFAGHSSKSAPTNPSDRVPTGEKGIGRFAADKLGKTLDVFTSKTKSDGTHLQINWEDFNKQKRIKFSEVEAEYKAVDLSHLLHNKPGTILEIRKLRAVWDKDRVERTKIWLSDLINPISPPKDFSMKFEFAGDSLGQLDIVSTTPNADLLLQVSIKKGQVRQRLIDRTKKGDVAEQIVPSIAELKYLNGLRARIYHFDKRPKKQETKGLLPGVRIYRDGFRIEPFGDRSADWLGIAEQRAKRAGHAHIVPNRLFGFVEISRTNNPDLQDTTSRQALLDDNAARSLVTLLRENVSRLAESIRARTVPRWKANQKRRQAELESARLHTLGEVAAGLAHELRQPLQVIRSQADNIKELIKNKSTSIDQDVDESQQAIDKGITRIDRTIKFVSSLAKGSITDISEFNLVDLLQPEIEHYTAEAQRLGIKMSFNISGEHVLKTNEAAIVGAVTNFIRNAIQSIASNKVGKKIDIAIKKTKGKHRIEVEDDGVGVPEDVLPNLFKKFSTKKTGGMGVGLHYSKIFAESIGGTVGYSALDPGARFWIELPETK